MERILTHDLAGQQDNDKAEEQAKGRRDLNEAGIEATPARRRMFGHIGRRPAIFSAQGQTLNQTHGHQGHGREDADLIIAGQHTDHEGG